MGRGERTTARVSVAVPDVIRQVAPKHPDLVGLPKGSSRAKVYERLLELGWEAALRARREQEQLTVYAAYEQDAERQAVARADHESILRGRVV